MKFSQLPVGAEFRFHGQDYRKTGSLTAETCDGGRTCLMHRSANVTAERSAEGTAGTHLDRQALHDALQRHHDTCLEALRPLGHGRRAAGTRNKIEESYRALLGSLGLTAVKE